MRKKKLPKYVLMSVTGGKTGTHLRYDEDTNTYYRDAGAWGTEFKILKGGTLVAIGFRGTLSYLNNIPLFPCTKAAWKKGNEGYV